ncbi:MAG: hypothetical protein IJ165_04630 [Proteobacteria bacterium]|nr:hypothetical protein [Pseudomonadota bacterium]
MSTGTDEIITSNAPTTGKMDDPPLTNMDIYENYKTQYERLKVALDHAFYLEAAFIEYAIIEDRTASILAYEGNHRSKYEKLGLGQKLRKIKNCANQKTSDRPWISTYFSDEHSNKLMDRIATWKDEFRNRVTHNLMRIRTTTEYLKKYAEKGEALCKELNNLTNNYKSRVKNNAPKAP